MESKPVQQIKLQTWSDIIKLEAMNVHPPTHTPSFSKPRPAVLVKAKGENPHNPNQHGELRIIGEEGGGKQIAALYKQTAVSSLHQGQGWPEEEASEPLFLCITLPTFDNALLIKF